jgi:hypothetical protein
MANCAKDAAITVAQLRHRRFALFCAIIEKITKA